MQGSRSRQVWCDNVPANPSLRRYQIDKILRPLRQGRPQTTSSALAASSRDSEFEQVCSQSDQWGSLRACKVRETVASKWTQAVSRDARRLSKRRTRRRNKRAAKSKRDAACLIRISRLCMEMMTLMWQLHWKSKPATFRRIPKSPSTKRSMQGSTTDRPHSTPEWSLQKRFLNST